MRPGTHQAKPNSRALHIHMANICCGKICCGGSGLLVTWEKGLLWPWSLWFLLPTSGAVSPVNSLSLGSPFPSPTHTSLNLYHNKPWDLLLSQTSESFKGKCSLGPFFLQPRQKVCSWGPAQLYRVKQGESVSRPRDITQGFIVSFDLHEHISLQKHPKAGWLETEFRFLCPWNVVILINTSYWQWMWINDSISSCSYIHPRVSLIEAMKR